LLKQNRRQNKIPVSTARPFSNWQIAKHIRLRQVPTVQTMHPQKTARANRSLPYLLMRAAVILPVQIAKTDAAPKSPTVKTPSDTIIVTDKAVNNMAVNKAKADTIIITDKAVANLANNKAKADTVIA
jgi:hypothetical protein